MTSFKLNSETAFKNGLIIVERPHRGSIRVWHAFDDADALERIQAAADQSRADLSAYDLGTLDGALDWNGHDLSSQTVLRFADIDAECLDESNSDFAKALLGLEWATEFNEGEAA